MGCCTVFKRKRVKYGYETAFGDGTTSHEVRVNEVSFGDMGRETRNSEEITATDVTAQSQVITKPDTVTFGKDVQPYITAEPNTPPSTPASSTGHLVLDTARLVMGGSYADGYGVVQAASTTTTIKLAAGQGGDWKAGQIGFVKSTAATGSYPMAFRVKEVSTDDLLLSWAMPAAPLIGGTVMGSTGAYKTASITGSMAVQAEGENLDDLVLAKGGGPSAFSIDAQPREIAKMAASLIAAAITDIPYDDEHTAMAEITDPFPPPLQVQGGGLQIVPLTLSTWVHGTPINAYGGAKLDAGIEQSTVDGVLGSLPNGVGGHCISRRRVTIEAKPCFANYAAGGHPAAGEGGYWYNAYRLGTQFGIMIWWGTWPSMVAFCVPACQIIAAPAPEDMNGRAVVPLTFEERAFAGDDDDSTITNNATAAIAWAAGTVV